MLLAPLALLSSLLMLLGGVMKSLARLVCCDVRGAHREWRQTLSFWCFGL